MKKGNTAMKNIILLGLILASVVVSPSVFAVAKKKKYKSSAKSSATHPRRLPRRRSFKPTSTSMIRFCTVAIKRRKKRPRVSKMKNC